MTDKLQTKPLFYRNFGSQYIMFHFIFCQIFLTHSQTVYMESSYMVHVIFPYRIHGFSIATLPVVYVAHMFCTSLNSSRPDLSSVCLGWDYCCTSSDSLCLWPLDIKFFETVALSSHHFLHITSNSSRLDSLSACLGWDCCCTLLLSFCAFDPVDIVNITDSLLLCCYCQFPPPSPPITF
jgi:hypothetical protein